jgi:uncharacterized membrane protein YhhN
MAGTAPKVQPVFIFSDFFNFVVSVGLCAVSETAEKKIIPTIIVNDRFIKVRLELGLGFSQRIYKYFRNPFDYKNYFNLESKLQFMRKSIVFSGLIYFFLGFLFILSVYFNYSFLQMLLKALIIPSLIIFFLISRGKVHYKEDKWIITALIFSWIGDVLLQIKNGGYLYFLLGLISFLLTHILYAIVFFETTGEFIFLKTKRLLLLVIIIYGALIIYTIMPGLGKLQIPVTIYGIIITGMVVAALSRYGKVNETSYMLVFLGAVLFLISDSLIAMNKFKQSFPEASVLIMCTYLAGQFMIIEGTIKQYQIKQSDSG